MSKLPENPEKYVLATGDEGAHRLEVVNRVHGQDTIDFFHRIGVQPGWRAADAGCGVGFVSQMLAAAVGESGSVTAFDVSGDQIATARSIAEAKGVENIQFRQGSVYETGLNSDEYDLVYCRFVLMHVRDVDRALRELLRIVKPGGILAVEDGDFTGTFADPPSPAFDRLFHLYREVVRAQGADPELGKRLFRKFRLLGLTPQLKIVQPAFAEGEEKRLPEWTILECAGQIVEAGLADREEIELISKELKRAAVDPGILIGMARMFQVYARKEP